MDVLSPQGVASGLGCIKEEKAAQFRIHTQAASATPWVVTNPEAADSVQGQA